MAVTFCTCELPATVMSSKSLLLASVTRVQLQFSLAYKSAKVEV